MHRRMVASSATDSPEARYSCQLLADQRVLNISLLRQTSASPQPQCARALDHVREFASFDEGLERTFEWYRVNHEKNAAK